MTKTGSPGKLKPSDEESTNTWGRKLWGGGVEGAEKAIGTKTAEQLRALGLTEDKAKELADFYRKIQTETKGADTAAAWAKLMDQYASVLGGK